MLYTWGYGENGQLGHPNPHNLPTPRAVSSLADAHVHVASVSMGSEHTLILDSEGGVWSCGTGDYGILGHGNEDDVATPVRIIEWGSGERPVIVAVSAGTGHSGAVDDKGNLYMWGYNGYGQLGTGDVETRLSPTLVPLVSPAGEREVVVGLSLGMRASAVVTASGALYTCGDGEYGRLGHGDFDSRSVFTPVKGLRPHVVTQVSMSESAAGAVTAQGELYTWGYGKMGNLGHGHITNPNPVVPRVRESGYDYSRDWLFPKRVDSLRDMDVHVVSVSLGPEHSGCISASGDLYTWGEAAHGETGHGNTDDSFVPQKVSFFDALDDSVVLLNVGSDHTGVVVGPKPSSSTPVASVSYPTTTSGGAGPAAGGGAAAADVNALQNRVAELETLLDNEITRNNSLSERLAVVEVLLLDILNGRK